MLTKLYEYMIKQNIGGFFIAKPVNVKYLSGYTGEDSFLFITDDKKYFITDPRYTEQAQNECPSFIIYNWRDNGNTVAEALVLLIEKLNTKVIGFEGDFINYNTYCELQKANAELVPLTGVIEEFRAIKTPEEIRNIRVSCEIADRAFEKIIKEIRVGVTEKELASKLSHFMVMEGADTKPYGNILISGKRTSLLHGIPSNKAIEYGDFVLMDYGCGYKGYLSDMTRTVIVGKATLEQKKVYEIEKKMIEDSLKIMHAGVAAKEVYNASIREIKDTKYFKYHYNGIGHGIGLFVHEIPFMGPKSQDVLMENNVVTIEPGIYIPDWGGVRIEDQILILKDYNECLTKSPRDLIEL